MDSMDGATGKKQSFAPARATPYVGPRLRRHDVALWTNIGAFVVDLLLFELALPLLLLGPYSDFAGEDIARFAGLLEGALELSAVVVMHGQGRFLNFLLEACNVRDLLSVCGVFWPVWRVVWLALLVVLLAVGLVRTPGSIWIAEVLVAVFAYAVGAWLGYANIIKRLK